LKNRLEETHEVELRGELLEQFTQLQGLRNVLHKKLNRVL